MKWHCPDDIFDSANLQEVFLMFLCPNGPDDLKIGTRCIQCSLFS